MGKARKNKKATTNPTFKKFNRWFWMALASGIGVVCLLFLLASLELFEKLPTFEELESPESNFATEIISIDGQTLGKYAIENRTPVQFEDLPGHLVEALVATEDERFFSHAGIDFRGTLRAVVKMVKAEERVLLPNSWPNCFFMVRALKICPNDCFKKSMNGLLQFD